MPLGKRAWRPSRQRSPSSASMMTTGSVRGKCCALQASHSRRQPAAAARVAAPQLAQKPWRACQASDRLGLAEHGRALRARPALHGDRAQIDQLEVVAAGDDQLAPVEEAVAARRRAARPRSSGSSAANTGAPSGSRPSRLSSRAPPSASTSASGKNGLARRAARQDRHVAARSDDRARPGGARSAATKGGVVAPLGDAVERRAVKAEAEARVAGLEKGVFHASSLRRQPPAGAGQARQSRI